MAEYPYHESRRHRVHSSHNNYNSSGRYDQSPSRYAFSEPGTSNHNRYDEPSREGYNFPSHRGARYDYSTPPRQRSPSYNEYIVYDSSPVASIPPSSSLRLPSPSPPPPPVPRSPSPTYLATSLTPSEPLPSPTSSRKLLILDLNGTLLIRSAHPGRTPYRLVHGQPPQPRLRPVHPRPYMPSFRNYIFHPETKGWLDVMVWSSAQPHSVDDMVDKCFGDAQAELTAIWARDTLGLTPDQYRQKTQTTKDLAKPWSHLTSLKFESDPSSEVPSENGASPYAAAETPQSHSALTTLLLDDSPLKAHLQPYNHVCIKEYASELRRVDLEVLEVERWTEHNDLETRTETEMGMENEAKAVADPESIISPDHAPDIAPHDRKRKRQKKDLTPIPDPGESKDHENAPEGRVAAESVPLAGVVAAEIPSQDQNTTKRKREKKKKTKKQKGLVPRLQGQPEKTYDETLLTVIGILDEIKLQSNVAGWIRSGGLWGPRGDVHEEDEAQSEAEDGTDFSSNASTAPSTPSPDAHLDKRPRLLHAQTGLEEAPPDTAPLSKAGNDTLTEMRPSLESSVAPAYPTIIGSGIHDAESDLPSDPSMEQPKLWFDAPSTMRYWAMRGREALEALGIPVEHGIKC